MNPSAAAQFAPLVVWLERLFSGWAVAIVIQSVLLAGETADAIVQWAAGFAVSCLLLRAAGLVGLLTYRARRMAGAAARR